MRALPAGKEGRSPRVDGLNRVGTPWRGKPILSAEQIEDMLAYLVTLRE